MKISLRRDNRGVAAIEMAIALPVMIMFIYGIFLIGVAEQAIAGMQHGLGEGARLATVCINPSAAGACDVPTDNDIIARIQTRAFGVGVGTFDPPTVSTPDPAVCTHCRDLSVTFHMPMDFLFFMGSQINITRTKRAYVAF